MMIVSNVVLLDASFTKKVCATIWVAQFDGSVTVSPFEDFSEREQQYCRKCHCP